MDNTKSHPERVDEVDHLRLELAKSRLQNAQLFLAAKYKFGEGDAYDPATLEIKRAPKPESPK